MWILVTVFLVMQAVPQRPALIPADSVCTSTAAFTAPCTTIRGRVTLANGAFPVKIWPVGTRRLRNESFFSAPQLKRDPLGCHNCHENVRAPARTHNRCGASFRSAGQEPSNPQALFTALDRRFLSVNSPDTR